MLKKLIVYLFYRRTVRLLLVTASGIFLLVRCMSDTAVAENTSPSFSDFAGSDKCMSCHQAVYDAHSKSAHYLTAKPAEEKWIHGSFEKGKNTYAYSELIQLFMERRDSGLFQVVHYKGEEKKAMRFDMVIGSGAKGQSFVTFRGDRFYQLPITYFTAADLWSNSPGYPAGKVVIDKPITARCLECHVTYAEGVGENVMEPVSFNRQNIIYGVDCEKCHGPAAKHVTYQTENPTDTAAKFIVNTASLSRQQQLDLCALCHGGRIDKITASFSYTAGNNLSDHFKIDTLNDEAVNNGNIDVHGNQYGLMRASKCFRMSKTMTCNTCHSPHENERGKKELFSQKCISCHAVTDSKFNIPSHKNVQLITKNCIDCHMPAQPSKAITVFLEGEEVPRASFVRSHFIGIYPDEIKPKSGQQKKMY
ncbi:MAG: cytochrome c3 family protein [Chitinophagaceae bacterium]|nr:cytochrome c3 family protein [Chitinophagaceae bacterium]